MARHRLMMALVSMALVASACGTSTNGASADLPAAPEVREVRSTTATTPDDGLLRVVVTIPIERQHVPHESGGEAGDIVGEVESGDASNPLLREELLALPPGSTLVTRDGVLGYVDEGGVFVPLGNDVESGEAPVDFAEVSDIGALLLSVPGVESVRPITESTYAVTATSVEELGAIGVDISEDAPLTFTADPYEPYQWALANTGDNLSGVGLAQTPSQTPDADIDGLEARPTATGSGVVVAVIDSGVDFSHPDLAHARWVNPSEDCGGASTGVDDDTNGYIDDCHGWDFGDEDSTPYSASNDEHGTHVAGIIAARVDNGIGISGIAPDVRIMDLKVSDSAGAISSSAIARAIRYAADNGADVANLSLGTNPGASLASVAAIADAVEYAGTKGLLLVAAAGNSSVSLDRSPVYPASFDADHLLTVGASTSSDTRASFSNTGSAIELFAPGDLILSTIPGGDVVFMSGTSQASPIAAATAALMLQRQSGASPSSLIDQMVLAGDPLESLDGLAANAVRLNTARAIGVEADIPGVGDDVTIRGLSADSNGLVSAQVLIGELGGQFNQPHHWELSLIALVDGAPFAVTDHEVAVSDLEGDELWTGQTDGRGAVLLSDGDAMSAGWSTTLPDGSYALLVEAVPRTDPTVRLGDGFIARFDVGQATTGTGQSSETGTSNGSDGGSPDDAGAQDPIGSNDALPDADSNDPDGSAVGSDGSGSNSSGGADSGSGSAADGSSSNPDDSSSSTGEGGSQGDSVSSGDGASSSDVASPGTGEVSDASGSGSSGDDSSSAADSDGSAGSGDDDSNKNVELPPAEASNGPWSITNVSPRSGPVDTQNLVAIDGTFPEDVVVWFGGAPGETVFQSPSSILVETPRHAAAERVEISLRTREETVLRLDDGFAFIDTDATNGANVEQSNTSNGGDGDGGTNAGDGGSGGTGTDGDSAPVSGADDGDGGSGDGDSDGTGGQEPTFDDDPEDVVNVDSPPSNDDGSDGNDDSKSRNRQARANTTGDPRTLPNGLTGVPLSGLVTIGGVPACDEALCRTRRI